MQRSDERGEAILQTQDGFSIRQKSVVHFVDLLTKNWAYYKLLDKVSDIYLKLHFK